MYLSSVGGHAICSAGFAPRLKRVRIGKHAAKGFDRRHCSLRSGCRSCDNTRTVGRRTAQQAPVMRAA